MNDTSGQEVDILSRLKRRLVGGQRKVYGENKLGCVLKRSVRIYLRREDFGSCGR